MKIIIRMMAAALLSIFTAVAASAQGLPQAKKTEEVGLSSERLNRIDTLLRTDMEKGKSPALWS